MLRLLCASIALAVAAACAAPGNSADQSLADVFQGEPVVVHLDIGGLT